MVTEDGYYEKFASLINALHEARALYEGADPQTKLKSYEEWENLKQEFSKQVSSHWQAQSNNSPSS